MQQPAASLFPLSQAYVLAFQHLRLRMHASSLQSFGLCVLQEETLVGHVSAEGAAVYEDSDMQDVQVRACMPLL